MPILHNERKHTSRGRSSVPKAFTPVSIFLLAVAGIVANCHADEPVALPPKLKPIPVCRALSSATVASRIPLDGIDASATDRVLHPGDSMTIVGTVFAKKKESQWLLYVESQTPTNTKSNPPPLTINLFGSPIKFESRPVPAKLRMLGPFEVSDSAKEPKEQTAKFDLNESFLALGLEQAAEVMHRRSAMTNSPDEKNIMKAKLTPEEQRALSGLVPALSSYFEIVQNTDGLESLLYKVVKLPSVWSIVRSFGVTAEFNVSPKAIPANPADWNLPPGTPVYYLHARLLLNKQEALKATLVVTTPDPPRLICGGVLAILAEKPGDDNTYMTLRLISAKCRH